MSELRLLDSLRLLIFISYLDCVIAVFLDSLDLNDCLRACLYDSNRDDCSVFCEDLSHSDLL